MTIFNTTLQKKRGQLKKQDGPHTYQIVHDVALDRKDKENSKAKQELQKRDNNAQAKKRKAALTQRDNKERSKKQS